jgi:hypothetical protein
MFTQAPKEGHSYSQGQCPWGLGEKQYSALKIMPNGKTRGIEETGLESL